ncbi:MAG: sigma factor-like helix-turn-helix DNA-binding protein [Candidatus Methylomirabilales bacterium]
MSGAGSPGVARLSRAAGFRRVVELVDLGSLSNQEVAVTLKVPVGTVMSRLHRGRGRIRTALEAAGIHHRKEGDHNPPPASQEGKILSPLQPSRATSRDSRSRSSPAMVG